MLFRSVAELAEAGVVMGLGTSGGGSNDTGHLLADARLALQVSGLVGPQLPARDVLTMATRGGARAAGQGDDLGALEPGRLADLVVVDLDSVFVAPVHRVVSALVFNVTPREVRHVIVDGRPVIRDRRLVVADEHAELRRAMGACRELFARAGLGQPLRVD